MHDTTTKTTYTYGNLSNGESPDAIYKVNIDGRNVLSYNYDKLGRLSYDSLNCGNVTIDTDYRYADGYKADSTTTRVTSLFNGIVDLQYEYDVLGNISSVRDRFTNQTTRYEYDELGQLVCEHNPQLNKTIRYVYDNCGNIRIKREYALNAAADAIPTVAYSYLYDSTWSDKLVEYKGNAITYDAIGNPLNYRDNMTFTWRNGRQMATATKNNYSLSFKYDDNGIRTEKISTMQTNTTTTKTTTYYLNGSQILSQLTGTEQIDFMYDAGGEVIGLKFNGANYYYLKNLQGDILYVVDSSGQIVVKYDYDSWGKLRSTAGSMATTLGVKNPFRYRSYYYDTETGLYYLNSRYYDPDTGRFVNADGYFSTGQGILGNNMFTYCNNNPVILCDPSGTCPIGPILIDPDCPWCFPLSGKEMVFKTRQLELQSNETPKSAGNEFALYDNHRHDPGNVFHEQILSGKIDAGLDLTNNNVGINTSLTLITGSWEYKHFDISPLDFGKAEIGLGVMGDYIGVGCQASIWSPSITIKVFTWDVELEANFGSIGAEASYDSGTFNFGFSFGVGGGVHVTKSR